MKTFRFHFNLKYASDLRNAVNDRQKQSIDNVHQDKQVTGDYYAWNRTCAAMDRLEDTLGYINEIELGKCERNRTAFDFYDFINNAYIVIDCIKTIGKIFRVNDRLIEEIEKSETVFGSIFGKGSCDQKYFEYVRSLCCVHPLCTNHQKEFLNGNKFFCCPYVTWENEIFPFDAEKPDLTAVVYPSNPQEKTIRLGLNVSQFEQYLEKWIDLIPEIIDAKNNYTDTEYDRLRNEPIKALSDYSNDVVPYIAYLKSEYLKRFDYWGDYEFDNFIRVFSVEVSDSRNAIPLGKYRNAIIYSLQFERNALQNMSYEGYNNTGIKYPEHWIETTLFDVLDDVSTYDSPFSPYSYHLEKLSYLEKGYYNNYENKQYARLLLEEMKALINQYVFFTNAESDDETIVLVNLAQYLDALTRKCLLNRNIPNELKYRMNTLPNELYQNIVAEESSEESTDDAAFDLQQLLKLYGG